MPNALYQGKRKSRRKLPPSRQQAHDTTDSEELDHSDSGYSSPMHRKNLISSGTDAQQTNDAKPNDGTELPLPVKTNPAASPPAAQPLSYLAATVGNSILATPPPSLISYASVVATGASMSPQDAMNDQEDEEMSNGAKSGGEDPTSKTKRKRKRGRRRRKRGKLRPAALYNLLRVLISARANTTKAGLLGAGVVTLWAGVVTLWAGVVALWAGFPTENFLITITLSTKQTVLLTVTDHDICPVIE